MFYPDERGIWDSMFVIGSVPGDVMKVRIGECSMEEVKGAVSSMK